MVILNYKIKAFTILESMIAMVIIMVVFGLTAYVFLNIINSGMTPLKKRAYEMVQAHRIDAFVNKRFIDEQFNTSNLTIVKTILDDDENKQLKVLHFQAHHNNALIYESKDLILISP